MSLVPWESRGRSSLRLFRAQDRRDRAVEPILSFRESEPGIAHSPVPLARRVAGSGAFQGQTASGILPKMPGPTDLDLRAARGIGRSLPGVSAHRTPPLIDELAYGQVGRVHRGRSEPPAHGAADRRLRRGHFAVVLNHLRAPAAFKLATKMQGILQNVQCAPPVSAGAL